MERVSRLCEESVQIVCVESRMSRLYVERVDNLCGEGVQMMLSVQTVLGDSDKNVCGECVQTGESIQTLC